MSESKQVQAETPAGPDEVMISDRGRSYRIFLPDNATDYIQKKIRETGLPYELDMLNDMASRLSAGDLVFDVGANVGNHTLYLAAISGVRVWAFEPNAHLADAIRHSARLNGLQDQVQVFTNGVGEEPGWARFDAEIVDNLGSQSLSVEGGDIPVITLDRLVIDAPVKMIKIDVEGMEMAVLRGARALIARDQPIIYAECLKEADFRQISTLLGELGYLFWDTFNASATQVFLPRGMVTPEMQLLQLRVREAIESYRNEAELKQVRADLHNANLKYRRVTQQLVEARQALSEATQSAVSLQEQIEAARGETQAAQARIAELEAEKASLHAAFQDHDLTQQELVRQVSKSRQDARDSFQVARNLKVELEAAHARNAAQAGQVAALEEEKARLHDALKQARQESALNGQHHARAAHELELELARAKAQIDTLRADVQDLKTRLHHQIAGAAAPGEDRPLQLMSGSASQPARGHGRIDPGFLAGWALALPLPAEDIAHAWLGLASRLQQERPEQALALLRVVHQLHADHAIARALGFALINAGESAEALSILPATIDELNLSSWERRALALARRTAQEGDGAACMARAVRSNLRVAAIMDEFTAASYAPECHLQQLSVASWKAELESFKPQLLLIESAWRGLNEEWGAKVGHLSVEVQGILSWCRARNVPTAFWNKEDPVHFETFLNTAEKFDLIFTTDIDCISRYKAALGHDNVYLLPFACQPEVNNPIELYERKDAFCFAGAYYVRYPDRTRDLDDFVENLPLYRPIEIFDRNFGKDHPDYMFPEIYHPFIVGTLPHTEIDKAYKGYRFGINLNSVKHSQSMYARRMYELLASNTRVVSNYSWGLRLMFGDLVVTTDSGAEAVRRIREQDSSGHADRIRLQGLRKVLSEHTYSHRLAYVARKAGIEMADPSILPGVVVLAHAHDKAELDALLAHISRQALPIARVVLVVPEGTDPRDVALPLDVRVITEGRAATFRLGDLVGPDEWLAGFVAADHYGAHYLDDLVLATRYSDASVFGKSACYRAGDGAVDYVDGQVYRPVTRLPARRALIRGELALAARLDQWLNELPSADVSAGKQLALDPFNYCENGAAGEVATAIVSAQVDDLPELNCGIAAADLIARAEAMAPSGTVEITDPVITGAELFADIPPTSTRKVEWSCEQGDCIVTSALGEEDHHYFYEKQGRPLAQLLNGADLKVHGHVGTGLNVLLVAVFHDRNMNKISHQIMAPNRSYTLDPPDGTEFVRFGVRFRGPGSCRVHGLILGEYHPAPREIIARSRILVLTNHYPSYEDLYRNGFVHSRMKAYQELGGVKPDLFRLKGDHGTLAHEFQNIDCMTGSAEQLDRMLADGHYDHVLVHFLDEAMWKVLSRHIDRLRVTVWVHGAEVQPWWRRSYNYTSEEELEKARLASDKRLAFWRSLFAPLPANLDFVFVSEYFASEVFEDLQVRFPAEQCRIIHNPIDDELFAYQEKSADLRGKILSIRPFASPKYANDLSVKAILELQKHDFFPDLEFCIIGRGPLFEEVTAPLAGLPNVICDNRFLSHAEIAEIQKGYGVFLNPTRWDSHGVSRDEAMSSGLVPVTSRVAAIPEFVDETCGYLADPEDAGGLAAAIVEMWQNPDIFQRKSRAAAERVRRQSGKRKIIEAELAVLKAGG